MNIKLYEYNKVLYKTLHLYPKCTNSSLVDFPKTTIPTIPLVRALGYTLREWEFRLLKGIQQLTIWETDVRDYGIRETCIWDKDVDSM